MKVIEAPFYPFLGTSINGAAAERLANFSDLMIAFWAKIAEWRRRSAGRARLAQLDSRLLRDIGIDQSDQYIEVNKFFWER